MLMRNLFEKTSVMDTMKYAAHHHEDVVIMGQTNSANMGKSSTSHSTCHDSSNLHIVRLPGRLHRCGSTLRAQDKNGCRRRSRDCTPPTGTATQQQDRAAWRSQDSQTKQDSGCSAAHEQAALIFRPQRSQFDANPTRRRTNPGFESARIAYTGTWTTGSTGNFSQ